MSSPRRSPRVSGGDQVVAAKRQRVAELQQLITAERAAVQGATSRTKELNDARRILEAAKQCSNLSALFNTVRDLPEGERLTAEHSTADRARKARLTELERQLADRLERQQQLQLQLEQLRKEIPPASQARQQLRRAQNNSDVQREYTAMLEHYGDLTHLYNVLEKLMVTADVAWIDSADWMERIRPAYHALPRPSHVLRADLRAASEDSSDAGGSGESSPP